MTKKVTMLDKNWSFAKTALDAKPGENDWQSVTVPHDWAIFDPKTFYESAMGWYCLDFEIQELDSSCYYLDFDGIYMDSQIYLNDTLAAEWKYGYSALTFDATPYLKEGKNHLLVKIRYKTPNSRWYSGAGIYRPVALIQKPKAHLIPHGIYVHSDVDAQKQAAKIQLSAETKGDAASQSDSASIRYKLMDQDDVIFDETAKATETCTLNLDQIKLWSTDSPHLYDLQVSYGEDQENLRIGFRETTFDPDQGFLLNGEKLKLQGACEHHDLGLLGAAYHSGAARRKLETLQSMGVNAIRTAHNMPARDYLDLCDELGIVVIDEAFDMWRSSKTEFDYARFFDDWAAKDVASWVRRDRNHPCVVMWSIGNEIFDTHGMPDGKDTLVWLRDEVKKYDPQGNAEVTFGCNYLTWEPSQKAADELKIVGYNYTERLYDEHHAKYPDWVIYGSETSSVVQSRGIYHFPYEQPVLADDDLQCSSLGNSSVSWGAKSLDWLLQTETKFPFSMGQFIWTGTDYIGEPTPYHTKNSYFGQIDTAGFPKDSYYGYKAAWTSPNKPSLHLYPYWDWNPGEVIDVIVASNASSVELFVNNVSQGRKALNLREGKVFAYWKVAYEPGYIKAVAFDEDGKAINAVTHHSFGDSTTLVARCETYDDLHFITVQTQDDKGYFVENDGRRIFVETTGDVQLIGIDNGDSTDFESYRKNHRRLFQGKAMVCVQGFGAGKIKISAEGLEPVELDLPEIPQAVLERTCPIVPALLPETDDEAREERYLKDQPIRKVELKCDRDVLDPDHPQATISFRIFPEDASDQNIQWRVTERSGLDSPIASFDPETMELIAEADGDFYLRAMPTNGKDHPAFISTLQLKADGFGEVQFDPYETVPAAHYDDSSAPLGNGNERGIATEHGTPMWIAYKDLDFGKQGSKKAILHIFSFDDDTPIRLWRGIPGEEGSAILYDDVYSLPSRWNTYQTYTFELNEVLRGVHTFSIQVKNKCHIKDFRFEPYERAFETLEATEADTMYGDDFEVSKASVNHIGNNVSLIWNALNFGDAGAKGVRLKGRGYKATNPVHLNFEAADGTNRRELLEVEGSDEVTTVEMTFDKAITGKQNLSVIFLPGSDFDLYSLEFFA